MLVVKGHLGYQILDWIIACHIGQKFVETGITFRYPPFPSFLTKWHGFVSLSPNIDVRGRRESMIVLSLHFVQDFGGPLNINLHFCITITYVISRFCGKRSLARFHHSYVTDLPTRCQC